MKLPYPAGEVRQQFPKRFDVIFSIGPKEWEGGYSNWSKDPGGETYGGVSRRTWKTWDGWKVIDTEKRKRGQSVLKQFEVLASDLLHKLVYEFYYHTYYMGCNLDKVSDIAVASALHDFFICGGRVMLFYKERFNAKYGKKTDPTGNRFTAAEALAMNSVPPRELLEFIRTTRLAFHAKYTKEPNTKREMIRRSHYHQYEIPHQMLNS